MGYNNYMAPTRTAWVSPVTPALFAAVILVVFLALLGNAQGQEAVRMSIASAEAAEARRKAETSIGYYNLKLGPTGWKFGSGLTIDYNDNVDNRSQNTDGDFIFRPQ